MGCGASAVQLREAKLQVDELHQKVARLESEKGELQRRLASSPGSTTKPSPRDRGATQKANQTSSEKLTTAAPPGLEAQQPASEATVSPVAGASNGALAKVEAEAAEARAGGRAVGEASPDKILTAAVQKQEEEVPLISSVLPVEDTTAALPGMVNCEQSPAAEQAKQDTIIVCEAKDGGSEEADEEPAELKEASLKVPAESTDNKAMSGSLVSTAVPGTDTIKDTDMVKEEKEDKEEVESSPATCHQCGAEVGELFLDSSDMHRYCDICWRDYYGHAPEAQPLVSVEVSEIWPEDRLAQLWAEHVLPGWPPVMVHSTPSPPSSGDEWSTVNVRVRRETVGVHAREQNNNDGRPYSGEVLAQRYRIRHVVGEGHFTKAYLAEDLREHSSVCVKRHRNLSVEALADLMVVSRRMQDQDEGGVLFPRLIDCFYDIVGYTVESLFEGRNCLSIMHGDSRFFKSVRNLQTVAEGALRGLDALDRAGVVHNDVKPDNLIWTEVASGEGSSSSSTSVVKIVDFGCARLDMREEPPGRNWSLAEGGAGHLGKWSPEMALRLPITHKGDVWGVAISVCELHVGRFMWRNEADTAEVIVAQAIGLCNLTGGFPPSLMRRSPLDVRQLYTPAPHHFPIRQNSLGQLEALRPSRWGLDQVLGIGWRDGEKAKLGEFLQRALVVDPNNRPCASQLLQHVPFVLETVVSVDPEPASAESPSPEPAAQTANSESLEVKEPAALV